MQEKVAQLFSPGIARNLTQIRTRGDQSLNIGDLEIGDWAFGHSRLKVPGENYITFSARACEDSDASPHTWRTVVKHWRLDIAA